MADNGHKIDIDIELKAQTNKLFSSLDKLSAKFDEITKKDFFKGKSASNIGNLGSEILKLGKDLETLKRELLAFDKAADYSKFTDGAKQKVESYIAEAKAATKGVQNLTRTVKSAFASAQSDEKRAKAQEYNIKKLRAQEESAARRKAQLSEDQASRERIAGQKSLDRNRQFNEQRIHDETIANTRIAVEREKTRRQEERFAEAARAREFKAQQAELKREQELNKKRVKSAQDTANNTVKLFEGAYKTLKQSATGTITDIRKAYKTLSSEFATVMRTLSLDEYANVFSSQTVKDAITNASSLVESQNILNQVYETDIQSLLDWADTSSYAYGLSENNARAYIANISALLDTLGIKNEELTKEMATSYTKLAGDLASIWNKSTDDAYTALRSGIAGTVLPLRRFGINLTISALDEWVQLKGISDELGNPVHFKQLSEYNKQLVRYAYIMEKTRDMQGDYGETFNSWANQIKTLRNEWSNFLDLLGKYAIPIMQPVVSWVLRAIKSVEYLIQVLAEFFDLEPYSEDFARFAYMEDIANDVADDFGDADDNAKKLNNTLKKGVKLLDLYELNFGDDSASAGAGADAADLGNLDLSGQIFDELDKYKDAIPDFDIDIDEEGIREFARQLVTAYEAAKNLFNTVWNFKFLGLPSLHELADFLTEWFENDPIGLLTTLFSSIFAINTVKNVFKNIVWPALTQQAKAGIAKFTSGLVLFFLAELGSQLSGKALADAILSDDKSEEVTSLLTGAFSTVLATLGGFLAAGIPGAIVGGLASVVTFIWSSVDEAKKAGEELATDSRTVGKEVRNDLSESFNAVLDIKPFSHITQELSDMRSAYESKITPIVNERIPALLKAFEADKKNETIIEQLKKSYSDLYKASSDFSSEKQKKELETVFGILEKSSDTLGTSLDRVKKMNQEYLESLKTTNTQLAQEAARLRYRRDTGLDFSTGQSVEFTDEDAKRLEELDKYLGIYETTTDKLIDFSDRELYNVNSIVSTTNEIREGYNKINDNLSTSFAQLKSLLSVSGISEDDIEEFLMKAGLTGELDWDILKKYEFTPEMKDTLVRSAYNYTTMLLTVSRYSREANDALSTLDTAYDTSVVASVFEGIVTMLSNSDAKTLASTIASNFNLNDPFAIDTLINTYSGYISFDNVPEKLKAALLEKIPSTFTDDKKKDIISALYSAIVLGNVDQYTKTDEHGNKVIDLSAFEPENARIKWTISIDPTAEPFTILDWTAPIDSAQRTEFKSLLSNIKDNINKDGVFSASLDGNSLVLEKKPNVNFTGYEVKFSKGTEERLGESITNYWNGGLATVPFAQSGEKTGDDFMDSQASELESTDNVKNTTSAISKTISEASNASDAEKLGAELGNSYINGLTSAIQAAHAEGSAYNIALSNLVSDFKTALNNISSSIEDWVNNKLSQGIASLNLPEDITFSALVNTLKAGRMSIPKLANGAIIPPNNPFLAVLGDQTRGMNIEAPVNVISEAVREASPDPEITVNNTIYLGNTELRDYIVDTVIDSNLVTG